MTDPTGKRDTNIMNSNNIKTVGLLGAIALGLSFIPWSDLRRPSKDSVKEALQVRFEEYKKHRMKNDWVSLYEMTVPAHRDLISQQQWLQFFGHGYSIARQIDLVELGFDPRLNAGGTKMFVKFELLREKLPPQMRGVQVNSKEDLIKQGNIEIFWQRIGGEWYFEMDEDILGGSKMVNGQKQSITPVNTAPQTQAPPSPGGSGPKKKSN